MHLDKFISRLYSSTQHIDIKDFRKFALDELRTLIPFDAAIWSTGHLSTRTFHTHTCVNLPKEFTDTLISNIAINPISKPLFQRAGSAVDMSDIIDDDAFFKSEIYEKVFKPQQIKRILSSIHIAQRSGIYTLLSIYRHDQNERFSKQENTSYQRAIFHMIESASLACMLSLSGTQRSNKEWHAICDKHGVYHEVESQFLDLIDANFAQTKAQIFPLPLPLSHDNYNHENIVITCESLGDLYRVSLRHQSKLDALTLREREVVTGVSKGLSFKVIAKELKLSPSTVSNHLYRIYNKLGISSRVELAKLIQDDS